MTKLETVICSLAYGPLLDTNAPQKEQQKVLDDITSKVLQRLEPADLIAHSCEIYNATADEYVKNPHTKDIIDELVQFMSVLPDGACVLDIGCGVGRDSLFMSVEHKEFRKEHMGRLKHGVPTWGRMSVPQKTFMVTGIDASLEMLGLARKKSSLLIEQGLLAPKTAPIFTYEDMHDICDPAFPGSYRNYDGAWSCAALFTHTPATILQTAMESVSKTLKSGGLFFTSYTNGSIDGAYDKLLISSTGRIKYFSHPNPQRIVDLANQYGMTLKTQTFNDFEIQGRVIKENLFVSQFFQKE